MLTNLDETKLIKVEFQKIAKRIIKSDISNNKETLDKYLNSLINIYNRHAAASNKIWNLLSPDEKDLLKTQFVYIRDRTLQAFALLNCKYNVPRNLLEQISSDQIDPDIEFNTNETIMTEMDPSNFLKLASSIIKPYSGDPNNLASFLNSVDLINSLSTAVCTPFLIQFIKTRLEGKALEAIPSNANTVEEIKNALKKNIKPDPSEVIESKLLALRLDRKPLQDFTSEAEGLAERLKRSLVMEGVSDSKATDMVIKKMTETCRKSARSDLIKSVLASSKFESPQEVLSKFVLEIAEAKKDTQVLAYRTHNRGRGFNRNFQSKSRYKPSHHDASTNQNNQRNFRRENWNSRPKNTYSNNNYYRNQSNRNIRAISSSGNEQAPTPQQLELTF